MASFRPVVLSIAGSDSGGGAGIQADLRSISAMGGFAATVITALTAQNLEGVHGVEGVSKDFVEAQLKAVWDGFDVRAVKTGMLWSKEAVELVANWAMQNQKIPFIVDPVMLATTGDKLLSDDAIENYRQKLLPSCYVATPNLDEASFLLDTKLSTAEDLKDAAREFSRSFGCHVLMKGGHLSGRPVDVLYFEGEIYSWDHDRTKGVQTHGSGCTLSSLIATELAKGNSLPPACERSISFLQKILKQPIELHGKVKVLGHEEVR